MELKNFLLLVLVGLTTLGLVGLLNSEQPTSILDSTNSKETINKSGNKASTVSIEAMQESCQLIADAQLRDGIFETGALSSAYAKPSIIKNLAHYNSVKSVCAFATLIITFPNVFDITESYQNTKLTIYSTALLSDGSIQLPNNNSAVQSVAYSYGNYFTYPKPVNEIKYVDFELKQIGVGTKDYTVQTLGIGNTITKAQFDQLAVDYMGTDSSTLVEQLMVQ